MSIIDNLDVCRTIADDDYMYNLIPKAGKEKYFTGGAESLSRIISIAKIAGERFDQNSTVLDYGAGYGRVTRYFAAYLKPSRVHACDIHLPAVKFCREALSVQSSQVKDPFHQTKFRRKFDWIFAGSVFTHINADYWFKVLKLFEQSLDKGGCVMLTTAGSKVAELVRAGSFDDIAVGAGRAMYSSFKFNGFGYAQYIHSEERGTNLGRCVVSPAWVTAFVERNTNFEVKTYIDSGFWGRQDAYLLKLKS